ncbi:uncharacterized protein LOC124822311, partial [Vigna umbellata]|uniref:uncharacterized protein LOC124822311 n=1 Tax=Vigna umbellata TaxID=87088 RepID=UPI001F5E71DF
MESQTSFTTVFVPVFDGLNYQMWAVKMEANLDANDVWEAVEEDYERMKDLEIIKDYADKFLGIANKIRLLGTRIPDSRIVQKILVTIPKRYEAALTSLENSKDLSTITLAELLTTLQALEQRRLMRDEDHIEGALVAKFLKTR